MTFISSPRLKPASVADQIHPILSRAWLKRGELFALKTTCAVMRFGFVVGRHVLSTIDKRANFKTHSLVVAKFQLLLIELGDFILRLQERRFSLAQQIFEIEHFLLQGEELPVVIEQAVLRFEKLIAELGNCRRHLVEVAQTNRRIADFARSAD